MGQPVKLTVKIKNGQIEVDVDGCVGPACEQLTRVFKQIDPSARDEEKPEFHQQVAAADVELSAG